MRAIRYGERVTPREREPNCEVLEFIRSRIVNARAANSLHAGPALIVEEHERSK